VGCCCETEQGSKGDGEGQAGYIVPQVDPFVGLESWHITQSAKLVVEMEGKCRSSLKIAGQMAT
jgi:hypothetical protein